MTATGDRVDALAREILATADKAASMPPITDSRPDFTLDEATRVAAVVHDLRAARGERSIGWKIGFTNRTIWDEYGVHAPIWGPVYDSTVAFGAATEGSALCRLAPLVEPRIEPEIVFRIGAPPRPSMDERALLSCIDAVASGFEIVQSLYPGWRFRPADTVAAFALHGRLFCGPFLTVDPSDHEDWLTRLSRFGIVLLRDGVEIDRGAAENVLGGPLSALRHLVQGLADDPAGRGLRVGDVVTTGTLTRAFPVHPGEGWSSRIDGLPLEGLSIDFV